ncbi:MAG TPA: RsmD family RNA methyltransferase [Thermoanaerobaculaceae bacterium]|nr:RsmD family RNA methyltransferase [Thermoanaerobaculaceae bacterium]
MRITGGVWASRRIAGPPKSAPVRPTPDALREQAFAVLGLRLAGAGFLDLFAGTGVNSLEALSRGAALAVLVERSPSAAALIRRNFAALAVRDGAWELAARDVRPALAALAARGRSFEIAWCDPPFASWRDGPAALVQAREGGVLAPGSEVVLEAPPRVDPAVPGFEVVRELRGAFLLRVM